MTPTYSVCPAMNTIGEDLIAAFKKAGLGATIKLVISPAWKTGRITKKSRKDLEAYGIAVPRITEVDKAALMGEANTII